MNSLLRSSLLAASLVSAAYAAPQSFDFKDPKGVNNVQFKLDAPAATTGKIVLATNSLTVGNPLMREHLHSANWLDVAKYPEITFEASKVANVKSKGAQVTADVTGNLTVKGITKEVTVPVSFTYLADKLGARFGDEKIKGDLLVLRATFEINRNDFNIQPGQYTDKVAENIQLSFAIAGASQK